MIKKIFVAFSISLLVLTSCFKSKIEIPPTYAGVLIYQEANLHNKYVMFCAELTYKLNVLLEARLGDQPLEDVIVRVSSDGKPMVQDQGVNQLFEDVDITFKELEDGIWKLTFRPNLPKNTYEGSLLISTGEKLLSEVGASWSVDNVPNEDMSYGGGGIVIDKLNSVKVAHVEGNKFWIYVKDFGLHNLISDPEKKVKSKWTLDFYVNKNSSDYSLLGLRSSLYEVTGDAHGKVAGYGGQLDFIYEIDDNIYAPSPLKYRYSDATKKVVLYGGTEIVDAPGLPIVDPNQYPSSEVTIVWRDTVDGTVYYDLTYNGHTTTTRPIAEAEDAESSDG